MNNLNLDNPKMMDIAVSANVKGTTLEQLWFSDKITIVFKNLVFI
jgi:hypothetical protein